MKVLFARLALVSFFATFAVAPLLTPASVSAAYQSTDGGFGAVDPVASMHGAASPGLSGLSPRGLHGEIPVLSGTDLKGEPSILDQDWVATTVRDSDERDYILFATDPGQARASSDGNFSGWIAASVVFVAFQILYAAIKLGNWLAFAEHDRPLGTPRRAQIAKAIRRRQRRMKIRKASGLLAYPRRSLAWGTRRRM